MPIAFSGRDIGVVIRLVMWRGIVLMLLPTVGVFDVTFPSCVIHAVVVAFSVFVVCRTFAVGVHSSGRRRTAARGANITLIVRVLVVVVPGMLIIDVATRLLFRFDLPLSLSLSLSLLFLLVTQKHHLSLRAILNRNRSSQRHKLIPNPAPMTHRSRPLIQVTAKPPTSPPPQTTNSPHRQVVFQFRNPSSQPPTQLPALPTPRANPPRSRFQSPIDLALTLQLLDPSFQLLQIQRQCLSARIVLNTVFLHARQLGFQLGEIGYEFGVPAYQFGVPASEF
jgi:hypothetical protein